MSRPSDSVVEARTRGRFTPVGESKSKNPRRSGRPQQARAPPADDNGFDVYTIKTFCRRHMISVSFYFKLRQQGLGPQTMKLGKRVLVSKEAANQWRREREAATRKANATGGNVAI
jgi:hypothetical protein